MLDFCVVERLEPSSDSSRCSSLATQPLFLYSFISILLSLSLSVSFYIPPLSLLLNVMLSPSLSPLSLLLNVMLYIPLSSLSIA